MAARNYCDDKGVINMSRNPYDYYITDEEYEIAAANGISKSTLTRRIRNAGWGKEKAMYTPPRHHRKYPQWALDIARANGISINLLSWRVRNGQSIEEAVNTKVGERHEKAVEANRKYPKAIVELAESNGITYSTFKNRILRCGWDMYKAATVLPMTKDEACRLARAKSSFRLGVESFWNEKKGHSAK